MKRYLVITIAVCALLFTAHAFAQSSLGIGANEVALKPVGPFAHLILWINEQQRAFYLAMTGALKAMRNDPWQASALVGISFVYGILHAAGPGHGKAVISSYMVANETALRRGIFLSFISSMLQGLMAVLVVGTAWLVLRGTGISMNDAARAMEVASFALVFLFGLWLLIRKLPVLLKLRKPSLAPFAPLASSTPDAAWEGSISSTLRNGSLAKGARLNYSAAKAELSGFDHAYLGEGDACAACGHAHMADPASLSGEFNWKTAWSAIMAVGLRPCSGALIVLTFALLNGLLLGGLISVFAMALGTFITVAMLATLAVTAKNFALKLAGHRAMSGRFQAAIEVVAALFIALTGAILLIAALSF